MTRSSGDPEYGLLPASTKFKRDWIVYEAEAQAAHEEQAQAHVAPAEEQGDSVLWIYCVRIRLPVGFVHIRSSARSRTGWEAVSRPSQNA